MYILGAGMAGLLAGWINPIAEILEAAPKIQQNHKALFRCKTDAISKYTGIPFKKVKV